MTWVWNHSPVAGNDLLTLLAIADNAADDGTNAWPSIDTLARKTRLDRRTVRRVILRLEEGGHLQVDYQAGPRGTNRYAVVMDPGNLPPRQNATPADCPPGKSSSPPGTAMPREGWRSYATRTSFTSNERPRGRSASGKPSAAQPRRGAALPPAAKAPDRCPRHPGQYARFCGPCRSEQLAREGA
jgi:hypothetical protein